VRKPSIAEFVKKYVEERPYLRYALKKGLINYSALAREICEKLGTKKFDAVLVAIRRHKEAMKREVKSKVIDILRRSRLEIKTGVDIYITDKYSEGENYLARIEGSNFITYVGNDMRIKGKIKKKFEDVCLFSLISPEEIEYTPGVVYAILEKFFEKGINILELMSSYTDTMVIVEKKDFEGALEIFKEISGYR